MTTSNSLATPGTFVIQKFYQLSGIKIDGTRHYYDIDDHSGGYPYWSAHPARARKFEVLDKVPSITKGDDYMFTSMVSIEVLEVTTVARVVNTTELVSYARAKAMAEIAEIEKQLAAKVAALGSVK